MSAPSTVTVVLMVLLAVLPSFEAPVVPDSVAAPGAVGVPETVHVMLAPGATAAGGTGEHVVVNPAGNPETAHVAAVAANAGAGAAAHVNVPVYGVPTVAVVGRPLKLIDISAAALTNEHVIVCPPPPRSAAATVTVVPAVVLGTTTPF
jgi:hypothetical protein